MLKTIVNHVNTSELLNYYQQVRQKSEDICQPLEIEDYVVQSMPDASPIKWHLGHTTWFYEAFILVPHLPNYQVFHPKFDYIFNSYYELGERVASSQRGTLSRPTVEEVYKYREYVDNAIQTLTAQSLPNLEIEALITLGLNHEQQHQEFLLTNIKHIFANNPLRPVYNPDLPTSDETLDPLQWLNYPAGLYSIGYDGEEFSFDNEIPRHQVYLQEYLLASRLVTNEEYLEFIEAGGYQNPDYWLSEGWKIARVQNWQTPLYWEKIDGAWWIMTLGGLRRLNKSEPVCHVSFYEADAYSRFRGKRLPTEAEWENATNNIPVTGNLLEKGFLQPTPAANSNKLQQMFGDVWQWTQSSHHPYPGYRPVVGVVGEYNSKLMCNRLVLRGGSCVTPQSHIRPSYRNFYSPETRWQFSGIRLAQTA